MKIDFNFNAENNVNNRNTEKRNAFLLKNRNKMYLF